MSPSPEQLAFDLPHRAAAGAEDFLISGSNEAAVAAIDSWPAWPKAVLAVIGPAGSGKTHLVNVWRARSAGHCLPATELSDRALRLAAEAGALCIEDIDRGIGDEQAFFHLLNLAGETRVSVLITASRALGEIAIGLPDLRSRLRALPFVRIGAPDEALLRALLVKLFSDRQLAVEPRIVSYLALNIERSAAAAATAVELIDRLALSRGRRATRALATEALRQLQADGLEL
jgi:chromosomal replication initiation ATPase DnaA